MSLAAQKFISDVINDTAQEHKVRVQKEARENRAAHTEGPTLCLEDLSEALANYNVRPIFAAHATWQLSHNLWMCVRVCVFVCVVLFACAD